MARAKVSRSVSIIFIWPSLDQAGQAGLNLLLWVHDGGLFAEDNKMGVYGRT